MASLHASLRLTFLATALVASSLAQTFNDGAPSGDYESYVYALEWQPAWSQPPECSPTLAAHLSPTAYAATHLSSHGLWPNYDPELHDGMAWPQFCVRPDGEAFTDCEANFSSHAYCTPSGAARAYNNSAAWMQWALEYSWSDLASHEWSKHGSCTPWQSAEYFTYVESMYYRASSGSGGALVTASVGGTVDRTALAAAFADDLDGKQVGFNCDASCHLTEVWTSWNLDPGSLAPTTPRDYGEGEPCPASCTVLGVLAWTPTDGSCPPTPAPAPNNATTCAPDEHGPVCARDADCKAFSACVRCASSGYCTDVAL